MKNELLASLKSSLKRHFVRYFIMAATVVTIELITFWLMDSVFHWYYLIATWASLAIGIVLNWLGSRLFVFGVSKHSIHKEFGLVIFTSLAGVALQSVVVAFIVEVIHGPALFGKVMAIVITFFWNYFVRKRYIYRIPV